MGGGIVVAQLQREGIGPAARLGDLPGREIASRDRHLHRLFGHARSVGGIAQLRLRIVRKGAGSRAERLPEILKGIFFGQDRSAPARQAARCAIDSGRSLPTTRCYYSATSRRSIASPLLTNETRQATPTPDKQTA